MIPLTLILKMTHLSHFIDPAAVRPAAAASAPDTAAAAPGVVLLLMPSMMPRPLLLLERHHHGLSPATVDSTPFLSHLPLLFLSLQP